jgi:3-phenylpropionate/trans-cinnamate dioxygenase ferredoxin reductase subunit|tara:strand:- start:38950 stop:40188 length:1239 start_codon:yes stop_codon:yes gene_type:complete
MSDAGIVIVGAGQAGYQLASSLRDAGYQQRILLIGDEVEPPYQRPPLSKAFLSGAIEADAVTFQQPDHYVSRNIELFLGTHVASIERANKQVVTADGDRIGYDRLVLATGAANRQLPGAAGIDGIFGIRTLADARAIRDGLASATRVVVIGGGFLGLEFAAVARAKNVSVTVVEAAGRLMARAISPVTSEAFRLHHERLGTDLRLATSVKGLIADKGRVTGVELGNGTVLPADLVVVSIGVIPNVELARAAGLACDNGIVIDQNLSTSDPDIFSLGDCAVYPSRFAQVPSRLESIQNAVDQARHLALTLTGNMSAYDAVPWFWSDQGGAKLQIAGLSQGVTETFIRGSEVDLKFSVYCFRDDRLVAIESVNRPADHMSGRKLLAAGVAVLPSQVVDTDFDLKSLLPSPSQAA